MKKNDCQYSEEIYQVLINEAIYDGVIFCPECDTELPPVIVKCTCGWINILVSEEHI